MTPHNLGGLICAELDPLMSLHGFQAGQVAIDLDVGVIYCMPHSEFRGRFPRLAPSIDSDGAEFSGEGARVAQLPSPEGVVALRQVLEKLLSRHFAG